MQLFVNNVINKTEGIKMNLSWVLDLAENVLPLTGDSLLDSFLFYGIGVASFRVAWYVAGQIESNSFLMSIVHWTIRIIGFLVLWAIVVALYWLYRLFASIPGWGWIIIGAAMVHTIVGIVLLRKFLKKRKSKKKKTADQD